MSTHSKQPPKAVGLYDPRFEHDACGVGMVARLDNQPTHEVVTRAITALENLEHRGASGADPRTGDGAGILMQMPDELLRGLSEFELPPAGQYGVMMCFLPRDPQERRPLEEILERAVVDEGQLLLGWRDVPISPEEAGEVAGACRPEIRQLFVGAGEAQAADQDAFERKLYVIRRITELTANHPDLYIASSSSRTINYKGMLISYQLAAFYSDLRDERCKSALALVHSRFSTNTFPSWELAHPYRVICHNGEINTVMGNVNWMRARESELSSELFGEDLPKILPVVGPGNSDSATFDNVLELLMLAGRTPQHAAMMMIPEAYRNRDDLPEHLKGFYAFHSCLMEPWDGPASVAFTDGRVVGATLDRNGLRPGRWVETMDGHVVLGSESGLLDIAPGEIKRLGRLQPGKLFLVDLERGRIVEDEEVKREVATAQPYGEWFARNAVPFKELPPSHEVTLSDQPLALRQRAFGYSQEDLRVLLAPMAIDGAEPIGSMGNDLSLAVLSDQAPPLFSYFKQLFAQVTNPPIDPIREEIVMSLATTLGNERNLLDESPEHAHKLLLEQPILLNRELETLRHVDHDVYKARTIDATWLVQKGPSGLAEALERICRQAHEAIEEGCNILILNDRLLGPRRVPIPSLLAVAAVHHHLVIEGTRLRAGIIVESGEPREVHHFATLIGYGASAINPYLMLETPRPAGARRADRAQRARRQRDPDRRRDGRAERRQSDRQRAPEDDLQDGDLDDPVLPGGADLRGRGAREGADRRPLHPHRLADRRHRPRGAGRPRRSSATPAPTRRRRTRCCRSAGSTPGGATASITCGTPRRSPWSSMPCAPPTATSRPPSRETPSPRRTSATARLSRSTANTRGPSTRTRRAGRPCGVCWRSAAEWRASRSPSRRSSPAKEIVRRFCTGAMSLGSISREAHETLAIAMNRLGGRSNTGEGGEDPSRFTPDQNGDRRRSAIKQVASGRFGVTIHYLVNADELQIKMAQGAKPGEGGQLPGDKVDAYIGSIRHTTPGVGLISPATAPRHLLDRGPQAADLRPALREPERAGVGQARLRGRGRDRRRGRLQGQRRPGPDRGPRRRHRRIAAVLDPGRRHPLGDRPGRDPADAAAEQPALAHRRADRRAAEDRPRRGHRSDAGSRRDGLLDRSADRHRLHHDAGLPPEHLPGRDRHTGPGAAQALQRHPGARRELLLLRGRGSPRDPGLARAALVG